MAKKGKLNYFKAYEELTELAIKEAEILIDACDNLESYEDIPKYMEPMHELENKGDDINHDIFEFVATDFVPPFDREDIVELAQALDNVLDYIDDVLGHMYIYAIRTMPNDAKRFAALILKLTKALNDAAQQLHNHKKNKHFRQLLVDINSYEEEGDKLYKETQLYLHTKENAEIMHVVVWSRIYERMEKCCDAVEHSANIISTILMKN